MTLALPMNATSESSMRQEPPLAVTSMMQAAMMDRIRWWSGSIAQMVLDLPQQCGKGYLSERTSDT